MKLLKDAELLTCQECNGVWLRQLKRGPKPKLCPGCRQGECEQCGASVDMRNGNSNRFCSPDCYYAWETETKRPLCECNACGKEFRPKRSNRSGKYCSRGCAYKNVASWHGHSRCRLPVPRSLSPLVETGSSTNLTWKHCGFCDAPFISRHGQLYCDDNCKRGEYNRRSREAYEPALPRTQNCQRCGRFYRQEHPRQQRCEGCCELIRRRRKRRERQARRARKRNQYVETVGVQYLAERDGGICGICGDPVDMATEYPDPMYPTVDHIVPLSEGGEHSKRNTQLAHFQCNSTKSNSVSGSQLMLVG